jgi:hypothetical protein
MSEVGNSMLCFGIAGFTSLWSSGAKSSLAAAVRTQSWGRPGIRREPRLALAARELQFHVAPMQCYTNRHLRFLLRQLSSKAVLWTEMEKVENFMGSADLVERTLRHDPIEHPLVLQLGGDDSKLLAAAARRAAVLGYSEVNLNCGCPSVESGGANFGAALMVRPPRFKPPHAVHANHALAQR